MSTISEVQSALSKVIENKIKHSVILWGPPGIGKSSIVSKVAEDNDMELVDLRISQLAPTDIRGLPYVTDGKAKFAPPSFFPQDPESKGIIFLDELTLASPTMMGIAQQLILDRQVGDYVVPENWYIVAASNRVEDRAAVSQMPAPVANRFIHFNVEAELSSWKEYAIRTNLNDQIISFLNFRPQLLFDFNKNAVAWPSPRSWDFANSLLTIGLPIESAVGDGAAAEFEAYKTVYSKLPDIDGILEGKDIPMPKEPSLLFATVGALVSRAKTAAQFFAGMKWLNDSTTEDYVAVFMSDALIAMDANGCKGAFVKLVAKDPSWRKFISSYQDLLK